MPVGTDDDRMLAVGRRKIQVRRYKDAGARFKTDGLEAIPLKLRNLSYLGAQFGPWRIRLESQTSEQTRTPILGPNGTAAFRPVLDTGLHHFVDLRGREHCLLYLLLRSRSARRDTLEKSALNDLPKQSVTGKASDDGHAKTRSIAGFLDKCCRSLWVTYGRAEADSPLVCGDSYGWFSDGIRPVGQAKTGEDPTHHHASRR